MLLANSTARLFLSYALMVLGPTVASVDTGPILGGTDHSRRLTSQQVEFVNKCSEGLLSSEILSDKIITQKEFTETYVGLCSEFRIDGCDQDGSFETLNEDVQYAFASEMCHTKTSTCLQSLITIGTVMHEVGYIVTSEGMVVENLVNNICYELEYAVFGTPSDGVELVDIDDSYAHTPAATGARATANTTNIIGAATAGSAFLLLLFLLGGERRSRQQQTKSMKDLESNTSYKTESSPESDSQSDELGRALPAIMPDQSHNQARHASSRFNPDITSDADEVFKAINRADWYEVYNMASKLSENEDLSTISSYGGEGNRWSYAVVDQDRSHLSLEDQQRTRTLDRLAMNRDWTGVAVTSALYADESSSVKEMQSGYFLSQSTAQPAQTTDEKGLARPVSGLVKRRIDNAVDSGDWDKVLALSPQAEEKTEENNPGDDPGLSTISHSQPLPDDEHAESRKKLKESLFRSNWALVSVYANRLRELESQLVDGEGHQIRDQLDINSPELSDSSDPEAVKKQTIAKLINEKKWKGISIMAGLYDMESKGSLSNTDGVQVS